MNQYLSVFRTAKILRSRLFPIVSDNEAENIARLFVESVTGLPWHTFLIDPDRDFTPEQRKIFEEGAEKLVAGVPLQYVLGETWFMGHPFSVGPGVLIPRPETEELVDWIAQICHPSNFQDICAGSGCIGISLQLRFPESFVELVEVSPAAAAYAQSNLSRLGAKGRVVLADILTEDPCAAFRPDLIVSNPPYVLDSDRAAMLPHVLDHEPGLALFVPDTDPLRFYHRIADLAMASLRPGGWLFFEIHELFGAEVCDALLYRGFVDVSLKKDMQGKDRMVKGRKGE
jgi:release factor glutamine methyltransferase